MGRLKDKVPAKDPKSKASNPIIVKRPKKQRPSSKVERTMRMRDEHRKTIERAESAERSNINIQSTIDRSLLNNKQIPISLQQYLPLVDLKNLRLVSSSFNFIFMHSVYSTHTQKLFIMAVETGNLHLLHCIRRHLTSEIVHSKLLSSNMNALQFSCANGHLGLLRTLCIHFNATRTKSILIYFVGSLLFLCIKKPNKAFQFAAEFGHLDALTFLHHNCSFDLKLQEFACFKLALKNRNWECASQIFKWGNSEEQGMMSDIYWS